MSNTKKNNSRADMPAGLTAALAKDMNAMARFASLSPAEQQAFISGAKQVSSKQEMQAYVNKLSDGQGFSQGSTF